MKSDNELLIDYMVDRFGVQYASTANEDLKKSI